MNNNGVLYYNRGQKCLIRLAVSLHSLNKFWKGPVSIVQHGESPDWFFSFIENTYPNVSIIRIPDDKSIKNSLEMKARLWRHTPYENTMFLDADTIVMQPIDEFFNLIEKHGLVFTSFCGWKTTGRKISGRIKEWEKVIGNEETQKAYNYGLAVNTGVFGFKVNLDTTPFLEEWEKLANIGGKQNCTHRILDEIACQVILHKYKHHMADPMWNASVKYGPDKNRVVVHFHGQKHVLEYEPCKYWKNNYWELRNTSNYFKELGENYGDRRFRHYLKTVVKSDVTIVSAANAAYLPKLLANIDAWMKTEGLREQQFLIYTNGFRGKARETRPIRKYKNVTVRNWDYETTNDRERMLAAFVLGTAKDVVTKYWCKLDGDCSVKKAFVWPEYQKYSVTATSWGFTKQKGDPNATEHWFPRLDKWWGDKPYFDRHYDLVKDRKVRHKRFCSFCCIEKTELTKKIAAKCGSVVPIPSHDTLLWYCVTRLNEPIQYVNFREYLRP